MIGQPKYDYDDVVKFKINNEIKTGTICIIDKYGTFFDNSDVSYDIMVDEENIFYKHIKETSIIEKV